MRQLLYTNYQSGNSGLSNGIMSVELGVILAFLTNRFLLLEGNSSPPANVVDYGGRVDNSNPSRITDLIDIPVPWAEPDPVDLEGFESAYLTEHSLMDVAFYVPDTVDIGSADASDFARGRDHWVCETAQLRDIPLLKVTEDVQAPGKSHLRNNLGFYSYLFYLDDETRRSVYQLLERMQARAPYAELAARVAADLGDFNAVHMRRGDFKVTYGVTVLDRSPWEAIDAMDRHFSRSERLLICTDERDDPFFDEIRDAWQDHVFIDHYILDNFGADFAGLPQHDSIALAYLSQLVAAESIDFIGSMTSTYTAMIQRLRGNRGKRELFKFFWNELPDPGTELERGRHPVSNCVPLEEGVMMQEYEGNYSWNQYSQLLNPAWMREWPESFVTSHVLETGSLIAPTPAVGFRSTGGNASTEQAQLDFQGLQVHVQSKEPGLVAGFAGMFHRDPSSERGSAITTVEVERRGGQYLLRAKGETFARVHDREQLPNELIDHLVPQLSRARNFFSWFDGMLFQRDGRSFLYTGALPEQRDPMLDAMVNAGWELLGDLAIPVRPDDLACVPFVRSMVLRDGGDTIRGEPARLSGIIYGVQQLHNRSALVPLSPSAAVAELARSAFDFGFDRERAVKRLCQLVEKLPVLQVSYSGSEDVVSAFSALLERLGDEESEND